jgi:hypothetical protein
MIGRVHVALSVACLCVGCATPQVAIDHANNGVRLTQGLHEELVRYNEFMKASAERRIAAVKRLEESVITNTRDRAMDDYLDQTSGRSTTWMASARLLDEASKKYASLLAEEETVRKELHERLAAVVKDLPTPGEKLGAVQKAMADLGTELSPEERFKIVQRFVDETKAIVDKNIKDAEAAAAAASASK